jgi:outer membrane protein OmpA-like peptidoglycan-associated protein
MVIEARNLPAKPSSPNMKEGQAENRRVEIVSTDPSILEPIRSTYFTTRIDTTALTLRPDVVAPNGIATWKFTAINAAGTIAEQAGKGAPGRETSIPLASRDLLALGKAGDIAVKMELQDSKGQNMVLAPEPVRVSFIQTSQRLAQKLDMMVQEKYALILFDFDKDTIEAQNREIINRIVDRIKSLPQATVDIVGHTDNIGSEKYNLKLSERRALSVYKMLAAAYGEAPGDRIRYSGVGPNNPLFDNQSPEARSFNRTVTITLEYLSKD